MGRGCCLLTACPFCIDRIALGVSVEYFFLAQKRETLSAKDAFSSSSLEVAMSVKLAWRITVSVPYILPHYLHALASGQEQGHPSLSQVTQGTPPTNPTSYPQNPNPLTGHATAIRGKQPLLVQVEQLWLCGYRFAPGRDSLPPERDWYFFAEPSVSADHATHCAIYSYPFSRGVAFTGTRPEEVEFESIRKMLL
jgi:hypothetical protein